MNAPKSNALTAIVVFSVGAVIGLGITFGIAAMNTHPKPDPQEDRVWGGKAVVKAMSLRIMDCHRAALEVIGAQSDMCDPKASAASAMLDAQRSLRLMEKLPTACKPVLPSDARLVIEAMIRDAEAEEKKEVVK